MKRRLPYSMRYPASASALGLALAVSLGACQSTAANAFDPPRSAAAAEEARGSRDEIVWAEIRRRENIDPSARQLIERLRPNWLRARGSISFANPGSAYPVVYIDGIRYGSIDTLHQITPSQIQRIEFIRPGDATIRWGTGHPSGVINIVTGR